MELYFEESKAKKKIIGNALLNFNKKIQKNKNLNKLKQYVKDQRKIKQIRENLTKIIARNLGSNKFQKN